MAKKAKDTTAAASKKKPAAPADPAKTRSLIRLLNTLALLLAIAAFLLQLFAVLTRHWKWQVTNIDPLTAQNTRYGRTHIYNDSRLEQEYGLYSRDVKLYSNNDEQLAVSASTRFPRLDADDDSLNRCLSQTSTLRGAFLTCSARVVSPEHCHCRRHAYWNWVIFFEVTGLILLGLAVLATALISTDFQALAKLAAAGLSILAFLFLLIGLILILSHLKRETRSFADAYPHIHQRVTSKLGLTHEPYRGKRTKATFLHQAVRRQAHESYRLYQLAEGQHAHNATHYQEFSQQLNTYVYKPYSAVYSQQAGYVPYSQQGPQRATQPPRRQPANALVQSNYGPVIGYDQVYDNTRAGIGRSTVLSILATILSLLLPLVALFSWLTAKKLGPTTKNTTTTTTTTVKAEYVPLTQEVQVPASTTPRQIPADYDHRRPVGDAVVKTQHVRQPPYDTHEPVIVRDVVIGDDAPVTHTQSEHTTNASTTNTQSAAHNA